MGYIRVHDSFGAYKRISASGGTVGIPLTDDLRCIECDDYIVARYQFCEYCRSPIHWKCSNASWLCRDCAEED